MTDGKLKDLKATKKKIFKATGLKLKDYVNYRNGNKSIKSWSKTKNSEDVSNDRMDSNTKDINHLAIYLQSSALPVDGPNGNPTNTYKQIEAKRRNLETPGIKLIYTFYLQHHIKLMLMLNIDSSSKKNNSIYKDSLNHKVDKIFK